MENYSSKRLENAVNELSRLPGIGKRTALRLALQILRFSETEAMNFTSSISALHTDIHYCSNCHNISDTPVCPICSDPRRDHSLICVVQDIRDIIAIENTRQFTGIYHVIGGVISPMEGIGTEDLNFKTLFQKISQGAVKELILALPSTIEGDTTNYYIYKNSLDKNLKVSVIARGVSIGDELEYTDEITLGRSLINRTPFETMFAR
ncbi:MAG: recombination mediator RecR [Bacteroidota bacterium]